MNDDLLVKWLDNDITNEELHQLRKEYDLDHLEEVLDRQSRLDVETIAVDEMYQQHLKRRTSKPKSNLKYYIVGTLTALTLLVGYLMLSPSSIQTINTLPGQRDTILLADNTKIILAPSSSISFNQKTIATDRNFQLEGEAYFDVPTPGHLAVETSFGRVEVLGTQFTIDQDQSSSMVECYEGSVKVSHKSSLRSRTIKAGQQVLLNEDQIFPTQAIGLDRPEWMLGYLSYNDEKIETVLSDLEAVFDIQFETTEADLTKLFNGRIPIDSLGNSIQYLEGITGWSLNQSNGKIVIAD